MGKLIDLTGQRFGRLTVIERAEDYISPKGEKQPRWLCLCDCGETVTVHSQYLKSGRTRSCGCIRQELAKETIPHYSGEKNSNFKHGDKVKYEATRLYKVWASMNGRCRNPDNKHYGGRGIAVCDEWRNDYSAFREWAMANGYDPTAPRGACTIDRIDVNGNYCPENCRWVSMSIQNRNKK